MDSDTDDIETLRKAYCPPLDDSTFYAIASDFDLPTDEHALTAILDDLRSAAAIQDTSDFDPSGTGGSTAALRPHSSSSRTTPEETSNSNGVTSVTTGLTELNLNDVGYVEEDLENLPVKEQHVWLTNLFPSVNTSHISKVLDESTSLEQAVDELLNLSFIEESLDDTERQAQNLPKGVDGFAAHSRPQQRKGRGKRKTRTTDSSRKSSSGSYEIESPVPNNVWNAAAEDVDFICSRTKLQPHNVRSMYHANGARLSSTIRALAEKEAATLPNFGNDDAIVRMQVAEVQADYEHIPETQVYGLLLLARNIPSASRELLEAMVTTPDPDPNPSDLHTLPQYAPPPITADEFSTTKRNDSWTQIATPNDTPSHLANLHSNAAARALTQASSSARRAKSNPHYAGAAAYYSSVAHENLRAAKSHQQSLANIHVAQQSGRRTLDLHGVSVADATRITSARVTQWWEDLGDAKYISGGGGGAIRNGGFTIVTGVGHGSRGGIGRIGPAVTKMLVRDGWKVEVGHGEIVVTGRRRR